MTASPAGRFAGGLFFVSAPYSTISIDTRRQPRGPAVPDQVTSLADFIGWCRANPDRAIFATTSAGSATHFVGGMLASASGARLTPGHYRGGAPALQDLLGGHVPASVNPIGESLPFAGSGKLRILAVT